MLIVHVAMHLTVLHCVKKVNMVMFVKLIYFEAASRAIVDEVVASG